MKIAQLTDSHLQAHADAIYKDVVPDKHWQRCLEWVAVSDVDRVLMTGDLCHDSSLATYQRLLGYVKTAFGSKALPCHWIPGNHDDTHVMAQIGDACLGQDFDNIRIIQSAVWDLVLLNSTTQADGCGSGSISDWQLQQLETLLHQDQEKTLAHYGLANNDPFDHRPKLLVLHHHSIPVGSLWQDDIMLGNSDAFCQLVGQYPAVKAVLCGHIHQCMDQQIEGVRFLGTPATSVQFACQQETPVVQVALGPGFRTLTLHDDGSFTTEVVYLAKH